MKSIDLERLWMTAIRGEGYYWREIKKRAEKTIESSIKPRQNIRLIPLL
jgi:hypothetical protein